MIEAIQIIILIVVACNLWFLGLKTLVNFITGEPKVKNDKKRDIKDIEDLIDDCLERVSYVNYNNMSLVNKAFLLQNILWLASDESVKLVKESCKDNCENKNHD